MENPFPGMDPWMEQQWGDAHHSLITYARDKLRLVLPADLRPRVVERVFVESPFSPEGVRFPDLRVVEYLSTAPLPSGSADHAGVSTAEPLVLELAAEPITEGFIQITDATSGNRVVSVVEVLSPSNKRPGEGQKAYLDKQQECRNGGVNLVEIDLLRGGQRILLAREDRVPASHRTPYRVSVWRATRPTSVEVYRVPLRERLPAVRIPLRPQDQDVVLDLQPLLNDAYRNGSYETTNYDRDPVPRLDPQDAVWADHILREKGLRKPR